MNQRAKTISRAEGIAILVGIVVGMGIFKAPSIVAGAAGSVEAALALWALGGVVTLMGALTYAELASAYPDKGGEYSLLARAYGERLAFVFGWSRLTVIQTGTIAGAGFVLGDYLQTILDLGPIGPALYAGAAVILVTGLNLLGLKPSTGAQSVLALVLTACLGMLAFAGVSGPAADVAPMVGPDAPWPAAAAVGFAMIFVLLTFGGWNEAAYLSGETARPQRDMAVILFVGVGVTTALYLAVNWAYLHVLGVAGAAGSETVGAALAEAAFGPAAGLLVAAFVMAAALSTMNGTLFTGARSAFALGRSWRFFAPLASWDAGRGAPRAAILAQGAVSLVLVGLGAATAQGFETMVAYTAPVFWFFFLLTGASIFVLRRAEPDRARPFRTPLFPLPPLLFCAAAGWMLWSSLTYAGGLFAAAWRGEASLDGFAVGAATGAAALLAGLIAAIFAQANRDPSGSD